MKKPRRKEVTRSYKKYMFDVKQGTKVIHVIDSANNVNASAAKFVNAPPSWDSPLRNAEFKQYKLKIYLVAIKNIAQGDEILAYYGADTDRIIK